MEEETQNINRDYGKDVDSLIKTRDSARVELVKSQMKLLELGVKTEQEDSISHLPGLDINLFLAWEGQEFGWEVEYKDGTIIRQFEGKKQNHYGHIDQSKLKTFRWVSCFEWDTDGKEKRVIVSLDFETGLFDFLNGFCAQEVRAELLAGYPSGTTPKLIMKMVKRKMFSTNYPDGKTKEVSYYNRYLIGWETSKDNPTQAKKLLCIEPNGNIHLWHE